MILGCGKYEVGWLSVSLGLGGTLIEGLEIGATVGDLRAPQVGRQGVTGGLVGTQRPRKCRCQMGG